MNKISTLYQLYEFLPEVERLLLDVLRQIILDNIPGHVQEKLAFQVPYFYGKKGICILWPASIPRGGVKSGVLLGFWYGAFLSDSKNYLQRGNNKRVYYRIFHSVEEIEEECVKELLDEAVQLDKSWI